MQSFLPPFHMLIHQEQTEALKLESIVFLVPYTGERLNRSLRLMHLSY